MRWKLTPKSHQEGKYFWMNRSSHSEFITGRITGRKSKQIEWRKCAQERRSYLNVACRGGSNARVRVTLWILKWWSVSSFRLCVRVQHLCARRDAGSHSSQSHRGAWCVKSDARAWTPRHKFGYYNATNSCRWRWGWRRRFTAAACRFNEALCRDQPLAPLVSTWLRLVLWDKSAAPCRMEKLLWKVTTKSDAGLSHSVVRTSERDT